MRRALQKLAGVAVIFGVIFSTIAPGVVYAQQPDDTNTAIVGGVTIRPEDIWEAINAPTPNLANTTAYIFYTISVIMTGTFKDYRTEVSSIPGSRPAVYVPTSVSEALAHRGLLGGLGFLMGQMFANPPASFEYYATDTIRNSRLGSPVYAQGVGFGALSPILGTWKAFRDVAYYLLTIMFLVTGFLILIRHKISGNMAVTVQNALPRLVLALILITFSYAIAGLIVDLMFLALYFIVNIFETSIFEGGATLTGGNFIIRDGVTPRELAFDTHIFSFMLQYIFGGGAYDAASAIGEVVTGAIGLGGLVGPLGIGEGISNVFEWIINQIFAIVFAVALFIAMFRVFFQLLMSYAGFVLNVVLSPLLLLEMTIPGRDPWRGWIKNLIGGLLPFVVCVFMIFMSLALTGVGTRAGIGYNPENPGDSGLRLPLILTRDLNSNAFLGILAMGFMLLLPESIKMAQDLVGAKGGPFDQYKDKAVSALKQGWQGTGVVPGGKALTAGAVAGGGLGLLTGAEQLARAKSSYQGARQAQLDRGASGARATLIGGAAGAGRVLTGAGAIVGGAPAGMIYSGASTAGASAMKFMKSAGGEKGPVNVLTQRLSDLGLLAKKSPQKQSSEEELKRLEQQASTSTAAPTTPGQPTTGSSTGTNEPTF